MEIRVTEQANQENETKMTWYQKGYEQAKADMQKQPLSDEAIAKVFAELPFAAKPRDITRAVEAAHNIG